MDYDQKNGKLKNIFSVISFIFIFYLYSLFQSVITGKIAGSSPIFYPLKLILRHKDIVLEVLLELVADGFAFMCCWGFILLHHEWLVFFHPCEIRSSGSSFMLDDKICDFDKVVQRCACSGDGTDRFVTRGG